MPWGLIEANKSRSKIQLEINGDPEEVIKFIKTIDETLRRAENLVEWVYSVRGDSISVPLNYRPAIKSAYPWLPKPIDGYIDDYLNSSSSVIILIGKPGTGKTTFIKNLIHRSGGDAKVTYDEKVMSDDSLFAGFIESDARFMIMEDADSFLMAREDGNTMMYRFLNVSDGLISAEGKKLVFSTNLPAVHDIDAALMRPGRVLMLLNLGH
jgi:SpoVK/Ycf46/Vps4 family AAA+-type ATPase